MSAESSQRPRSVAFAVLLRGALPTTVLVGVVASVVMGAVDGPAAAVCGLVGLVVVVTFFASGLLAVSRIVTDTSNALLFMAVGMAVYFAQVLLLLGVLVVARQVEAFDSRSAGMVMLVAVVTWQVAQILAWRRARVPVYDDVMLPGDEPVGPRSSRPTAGTAGTAGTTATSRDTHTPSGTKGSAS